MLKINKIVFVYICLFVVGFSFLLLSCKKDRSTLIDDNKQRKESNNLENKGIHVRIDSMSNRGFENENWLYFQSINDYNNAIEILVNEEESTFNTFDQNLSFNSMLLAKDEEERELMGIEDDALAAMLNPNGKIRIDHWLFELNVINDTVLVYDLSSEMENPYVFSIDDNILEILTGNEISDGTRGCSAKNKVKNVPFCSATLKYKVVYQKAGIYFSLQSKIKREMGDFSIELFLTCNGGNANRYRVKGENVTHFIPYYSKGGANRVYHYRPYSGTKRLVGFHFIVYFNAYDQNGICTFNERMLEIHCGE